MERPTEVSEPSQLPVLITTPLFCRQNKDSIQLLSKEASGITSLINVINVKFFFYIGKLPTWSDEDFYDFLIQTIEKQVGKKKVEIILEKYQDSQSFMFQHEWSFYKVIGDYQTIHDITQTTHAKNCITCKSNNYFLQHLQDESYLNEDFQVSDLMYSYYQEYIKIDPQQLTGYDRLMYQNLKDPFRFTKQDIQSIQIKYKLNFQDTLKIQRYSVNTVNGSGFKYDQIITVDIKNIQQNEVSMLNEHLKNYHVCTYDIENAVLTQSTGLKQTFTMWDKVLKTMVHQDDFIKQMINNLQNPKNESQKEYIQNPTQYDGLLGLTSVDRKSVDGDYSEAGQTAQIPSAAHSEAAQSPPSIKITSQEKIESNQIDDNCCDQNEIVCISFIISDFKGTILNKIALVRSSYQPDKVHADQVIQVQTEKQLLQQTIKILGDKQYNILMHYNGYNFDERMICRRCLMHNLIEDYICAMDSEGKLDYRNLNCDARMKITSTFEIKGIFQVVNPLRLSFDILALNMSQSSKAEKLEDNSLNGMLRYYGLELKEGVGYQEITDRFYQYQQLLEEFKEEYGMSYEDIQEEIRKQGLK